MASINYPIILTSESQAANKGTFFAILCLSSKNAFVVI